MIKGFIGKFIDVLRLLRRIVFFLWLYINPKWHRYALRWLKTLDFDYFVREKCPWLTFDAIDFLYSRDFKGKRVFEYGSGGSTLFWLERGAHCVSIEHDYLWYDRIKQIVERYSNIDYRFVASEVGEVSNQDFSDPNAYISSGYHKKHEHYTNYVRQIDEFEDESFDVVVIDGRARPSCIKHGWRKVKIGGLLILDNADREYYTLKTSSFLENFDCQIFAGVTPNSPVLAQTNIYTRRR